MSSVVISGNTSGAVTIQAPDVAGTVSLTLPVANGTIATLSGSALTSGRVPYATTSGLLTDSSGLTFDGTNFGVGIASPLFVKASIAASSTATSIGSDYNPGILNIQNTSATNGNLSLIGFQDASAFINLAAIGAVNVTHSGSPNYVVGQLAFYTKASGSSYIAEAMRLTSTGLGIGTSSPDDKLEVFSTITARASSGTSALRLRNTTSDYQWQTVAGTNAISLFDNAVGSARLTLDSSGNLGFGAAPSTSSSGRPLVEFNSTLAAYVCNNNTGSLSLQQNSYYNGNNYAKVAAAGTAYHLYNGTHNFYRMASVAAGAAQTFTSSMYIDASGNVGIGVTSPACILDISGSTGGQIKFPATQNASSNANTLDDYEEGTWTPIDSSGNGLTFSGVSGYYTKIGDMVFATFELTYPASVSSFINVIGGLPFTVATGADKNGFHVAYTNYTPGLMAPLNANLTSFTLYDTTTGNGVNNTALLSKLIRGTCIYKVA